MMQAIVKACLAVSITMGALMAGTASGQVPSQPAPSVSLQSDADVVPMTTCDDVTCDTSCRAHGDCEGYCTTANTCHCIKHQGRICP